MRPKTKGDVTNLVRALARRTKLSPQTSEQTLVINLGLLHEAIRGLVEHPVEKNYRRPAPVRRGKYGGKGSNSYPPEFKAKVMAEFPTVGEITIYSHNISAIARKYGISTATISRWIKQRKQAADTP